MHLCTFRRRSIRTSLAMMVYTETGESELSTGSGIVTIGSRGHEQWPFAFRLEMNHTATKLASWKGAQSTYGVDRWLVGLNILASPVPVSNKMSFIWYKYYLKLLHASKLYVPLCSGTVFKSYKPRGDAGGGVDNEISS